MVLSKYKIEILVLISVCSSTTLLKTGHFKSICTLTPTIHNFFQSSMFLPHEFGFHTRPRIPLTFDLILNRNTSKTCISQYSSQLTEHSHYDKTEINSFFYETLSKPISQWFLAVRTTMLQIYLQYMNFITKTYHECTPLRLGTFVLKHNFAHVHFSDKETPLDWTIQNT